MEVLTLFHQFWIGSSRSYPGLNLTTLRRATQLRETSYLRLARGPIVDRDSDALKQRPSFTQADALCKESFRGQTAHADSVQDVALVD